MLEIRSVLDGGGTPRRFSPTRLQTCDRCDTHGRACRFTLQEILPVVIGSNKPLEEEIDVETDFAALKGGRSKRCSWRPVQPRCQSTFVLGEERRLRVAAGSAAKERPLVSRMQGFGSSRSSSPRDSRRRRFELTAGGRSGGSD